MSIFEKNLEALQGHKKNLREELIKKAEEPWEPKVVVREVTALNGEPVLEVEKNGKTYRLNSLYSPSHEAEVWSKQFKHDNLHNVFVLFGLGCGYFARALSEEIKNNRVILVYEPSYDIFRFAMEHYDLSDLFADPRFCIVIRGINDIEFNNLLSYTVQWNNVNGQNFCAINGYRGVFEAEYIVALNIVYENTSKVATYRNTAVRFGKSITYNTIENIKYMYESNNVKEFEGLIPENTPAIIVAAGPSLDKNVDQIKNAKGKAVIIAVDRALDTLIAHNIMPDFSVTIDPDKPPRFYDNPISWEIPLFYPLSGNRKIVCRHTGKKIIFTKSIVTQEFYKRLGKDYPAVSPGGSVATAAVSIAKTMGIKNIILVGQDLAYENGYTHAGGVKLKDSVKESDLIKVKGIHGEELYTGYDMYNYILWYQDTIANYKDEMHVIDATEGGALIRGTEILTLEEAIEKYCLGTFDANELLEKCKITNLEERYEIEAAVLKEMMDGLKELAEKSKKAESLCNDLLSNVIKYQGLNNKGLQLSSKLSELNKEMDGNFVSDFIEAYVYETSLDNLKEVNDISDEEVTNQRKTFELSRNIYEANKKACCELMEYMAPFVEEFKKIKD